MDCFASLAMTGRVAMTKWVAMTQWVEVGRDDGN